MDIIDVDIENQNNEQGFFLQLAKRNSRFLSRYQTYLRIKHNREERKMSECFSIYRSNIWGDITVGSQTNPVLSSAGPSQEATAPKKDGQTIN